MATYPVTVFDHLDQEWDRLLRSGALGLALAGWRCHDERLYEFSTIEALLELLADASEEPELQSRILLALLCLAHTDRLAARLVLQRFIPALKLIAGWRHPLPQSDWAAQTVSAAFEVIVTYPVERRPSRVAANIVCDVRKHMYAVLAEYRRCQAELTGEQPSDVEAVRDPAEAVEAVEVLRWAAHRSRLGCDAASLIVLTRLAGYSLVEVAAAGGVPSPRMRQRRWRSEQRLRDLLSASA